MGSTATSVGAQRSAMALVHALRQRDEFGDQPLLDVIRDGAREYHPTNMMVALASLVPAVAQIAERRVSELLADPVLLRALADAVDAGTPMDATAIGLGVADVLTAAGTAATLLEPDPG